MERERVSSGTEWESTVGYSRAVRAGDEIHSEERRSSRRRRRWCKSSG
jgi:hypothetical protein